MMEDIERIVIRKLSLRLLPVLILGYLVAFIDRSNIGFATLTMGPQLGIGPAAFGFGSGLFFVAYVLFEVPSNLAQERFGARLWIARIMITWGLAGLAMVAVRGPVSFSLARFLLGAAEAGFFPGVILYLSQWFPGAHRSRIVALFMISIPLSNVVGSALSAMLLALDGAWGIKGWQWLFLLESLPAVVLGLLVPFVLADRPDQIHWLTEAEREWLTKTLAAERGAAQGGHGRAWKVIADRRIWALALIYCGSSATSNVLSLWQPQIIKSFGLTLWETALLNMLPFAAATGFMVFWGHRADIKGSRIGATAAPLLVTSAALFLTLLTHALVATMALLVVVLMANYALKGPFWALSSETLGARDAAAGLAAINAIAHLGTSGVNTLFGVLQERSGSFAIALLPLALLTLAGCGMTLWLGKSRGQPA
ncbi:MFS family permease [Novosphingobium sp. SG751A]|uniref:MFS transporter n=1 Tax=Novosphingobium sp. SG751A TaxID=2587000 RepID=UPI0015527793|nr:MFS transporter [Novosphingobium sp. SG751A]NOW48860.1 MFS family permease [Novosphingobium sp. SG751A]